jgi:serine phosphatase RsbU (regulator of sigma subunit)
MKKVKSILSILLICFGFQLLAQDISLLDSVYQVATTSKNDSTKAYNYDEAARLLVKSDPDSALVLAKLGLKYAKKNNNDTLIAGSYNSIGTIYKTISNYKEAINSQNKALYHAEKVKALRQIENAKAALGLVYTEQANYSKAIEIYYDLLLLAQNRKDTFSIAQVRNNLGNIYFEQKVLDKALENYQKAYEYAVIMGSEFGQCLLLGNLGSVYFKQEKYGLAKENYQKSLDISIKIGDTEGVGISYSNFGSVYFQEEEYQLSLEFHEKALEIKEEMGDLHGQSVTLNEIGKTYDHFGDLYKAKKYSIKALAIAKQIGAKELESDANLALSKMFDQQGNTSKAYFYYKNHIELRDSLVNEESKKKDIRNELNFEFQKQHFTDSLEQVKKDELAQQQIEKEKVKTDAQKKLTYGFSIAFILMLVLSVFIFKEYKAKKRANLIVLKQKDEVETQSQIILEKNKEITDSINYAKSIQTALLTEDAEWDKISKEHFVYLKPKDVVSGDFFWAFNDDNKNLAVWTAADCTGHGVPGAFMSMLGIGFLNEIVIESGITKPSEILNHLREKIIKALSQKNANRQQSDGIDMAICVWDKNKNELFYSGANNPLYIISKNENTIKQMDSFEAKNFILENNDFQLFEVKPDKQPVGFYTGDKSPFNSITIKLNKDDRIYVFSDGYADQFGGEKEKKLKYKPFKEILLSISNQNMANQKNELESFFTAWKGNLEQIDDVCVIGVRV